MGLDFDTTTRTPLTIKTRTEDGTEATHTFEVLPLTKPRMDKVTAFWREQAKAEKDGTISEEDQGEKIAEFCDDVVRSTNGPVTFMSMWQDAVIDFKNLNIIGQALAREVVGVPPA